MPNPKASAAAALLAETAPALVDVIREEARRQKGDASVSQLRALSYVSRHAEASLSEVAAVVGLSLPATSRLMDGLVERKLVRRAESAQDRRRVTLQATSAGLALLRAARAASQQRLASLFEGLPASDLDAFARVLAALQQRLPGAPPEASA